ncbi:MAG: 5'-nucleotidase C-terminal domain-containing protein [Bacteriovoracaceae bacterium]|nr:5'-nucleotidase C-terminal domain-containing protein [Bacteriovoracaceae bacterium]
MRNHFLITIIIILLYPFAAESYTSDRTYKLTILHTNDHHGHYWHNKFGEYGMAARMTLIQRIRKEVKKAGGHVLLVSGGDINTGTPESDLADAVPDFLAMNLIKYDAMVVGNHEFDKSNDLLMKQKNIAKFPFLSANIFYKGTSGRPFYPYTKKKYEDLRVIIMGFTTLDTPKQSLPAMVKNFDFFAPVQIGKMLLPFLRNNNDIIIAVTHLGYYPDAKHGNLSPGDVTLARKLGGIDIIIGGHTQKPLHKPQRVGKTTILQAHEWGKYVGRMDLEFLNGKIKIINYRLIPVNLKRKVKAKAKGGKSKRVFIEPEIPKDPKMLALLEPYYKKSREKLSMKLASLTGKLEGHRDVIRRKKSNLVTLVIRAQMKKLSADIGIVNAGNIRSDIFEGNITAADILKVHPYGNTICTVSLTGRKLRQYLQSIIKFRIIDEGGYPHLEGIKIHVKNGLISSMKIKGIPVDEKKRYKLSINEFLVVGGDGYPKLDTHPTFVDSGYTSEMILREYIKELGTIDAKKIPVEDDFIID